MNSSIVEALQEPVRPVSLRFQILLGLANAGTIITLMPVLVVLIPAQITQMDPVHSASNLARVLALGAAGAMVGNPLAGALSDRTTSRLGRRRPWMMIGMLGNGFGLMLLANGYNIPLLTLGWITVQFFGNVLLSSYSAILPDRVPVYQRGTTQAIIGLASPIAVILGDLLITRLTDIRLTYYLIILIQMILTLMFVLQYRETQLPKNVLPPFRIRTFLTSFWISPRRYPEFGRLWLMWLMAWIGQNLGTGGFFFLFVKNITRYENLYPGHSVQEGIALLQMLQIAFGVPLMMIVGVISDRLQIRKIFVLIGIILMGSGLILLSAFSYWQWVAVASVTLGMGFWIFYSQGLAMITQKLPSASDRGKDLGVINIGSTLPQIVMPWLGAGVINAFGLDNSLGYRILFLCGVLAVLLSVCLLRSVHSR